MKSLCRLILSAAVLAAVVLPPTARAQAPAPDPDGRPATPPTGSAATPGEAATGKTQAAAVVLPEDTDAIRELTPERAKTLVERWTIKNDRLPKGGEGLPSAGAVTLSLNGLTTLSADTAAALADYPGGLNLDGLTTLSADTAKALAGSKGDALSLNGLTALSDEAARALAGFRGKRLSLKGLTTLSDEATRALARFKVHPRTEAEPAQAVQPATRVEEDVAFFEKKYQKKITGVKPKAEYADPDQFYSAIAMQLGIPEIAWRAAADKYGWKKDDGNNTFTMVKGGPTAGGGQGTWDVMFIRAAINPETKKPDPATMKRVMVQIDYDGNITFPEIPKESRSAPRNPRQGNPK